MTSLMTRRRFFQALAASALVAGVPLPIGFPKEPPPVETANFFVDQTLGNDAYDGTFEGAPWKTVQKVNDSTFLPGDIIAFKRGD